MVMERTQIYTQKNKENVDKAFHPRNNIDNVCQEKEEKWIYLH